MSTLLKDLYNPAFYNRFADVLEITVPAFDRHEFMSAIFDDGFENKELKERMRHTTRVLHSFFPESYPETVNRIKEIITALRQQGVSGGLEYIFFPDYIETYGQDDYENSVPAIEFITQFITCEFAVRPFILKYGERMLAQMNAWSLHPDHRVRRLASEGTRPRLPWAVALPQLKKDPSPILPLLENLKNDPSEWVRRSVANSINDIAKDNPEVVIELAQRWKGISPETDALIKHGCRSLLKQGHPEILKHYGLDCTYIELTDFNIHTPLTPMGDAVAFSFCVNNTHTEIQTIRLEYAVYHKRQNGALSKKVFKISERTMQPGETVHIQRRHSFKPITTRRYYPGEHQLAPIVNGAEKPAGVFELV